MSRTLMDDTYKLQGELAQLKAEHNSLCVSHDEGKLLLEEIDQLKADLAKAVTALQYWYAATGSRLAKEALAELKRRG